MYPSKQFTDSLKDIQKEYCKKVTVIASINASILMVQALKHKVSIEELFMEPKLPVCSMALNLQAYYTLLQQNNIKPVLVFDRERSPLQLDITNKRYKNLVDNLQKLEEIYNQAVNEVEGNGDNGYGGGSGDDGGNGKGHNGDQNKSNRTITLEAIIKQQKKATWLHEDIIYKVKPMDN